VTDVRFGLTLPSFRDSPEPALAVADAAERAGLDAVFAYDHLFRRARDGTRRPALELLAMMGAVAAETSRVSVGSLVARATLRPPATLASGFDTVARIAGPGRTIATIGTGDGESREEMEAFGFDFGDVTTRVAALHDAVVTVRDRGYPVWVGGAHRAVGRVAATDADGWNDWGSRPETLRAQATALRAAAVRSPFAVTWGGLVLVAATEREADAKRARFEPGPDVIVGGPEAVADALRAYVAAGADWIIAGPVDSSDPDNAHILGELVLPLL
jgi:alkanesulfonate monooxygenase SsuD/methylene tetrahydromethanopterin reductase-like flavin-dependent oxidoreductase (luciferase family)